MHNSLAKVNKNSYYPSKKSRDQWQVFRYSVILRWAHCTMLYLITFDLILTLMCCNRLILDLLHSYTFWSCIVFGFCNVSFFHNMDAVFTPEKKNDWIENTLWAFWWVTLKVDKKEGSQLRMMYVGFENWVHRVTSGVLVD